MGKLGTLCFAVYQERVSHYAKHFHEEISNKRLGLYFKRIVTSLGVQDIYTGGSERQADKIHGVTSKAGKLCRERDAMHFYSASHLCSATFKFSLLE